MKLNHFVAFILSAVFAFFSTDVLAGAFIGSSESNPDFVLHPSNYFPGNPNVEVNVCINPSSADIVNLVIPVQNVIATFNALQATTGNLSLGGSNNIPSGQLDAESVLLHEVGHCIGLAHVNLATESGLSGSDLEYTKSTTGGDGSYDLNDGADNIKGSSDDLRDDDTNLHLFKRVDNNPFTLAGIIDSTTYSRNLADLPAGSYAANGSRDLAAVLGFPGTEAIMQQGQFFDEAQRSLTADGVATLSYGASGVDEIAGTGDDYTITLVYRGVTTSDCDISIVEDSSTSFASCTVGFQVVQGDHFRVSTGTVRLNENTNWFYNQDPVDPINMAPSIDPLADITGNENDIISVTLNASDPDVGDTLSFNSVNVPAFCSVIDNGDGTGIIECLPVPGDAGDYTVTVSVSDNGDPVQTASATFELSVLPEGIGLITQCSTPIAAIPDNTGTALINSLTISDSRQIVDIDVSMTFSHPFVSDIVASVTHVDSGASVLLLDRAGIPASPAGCDGMDFDAMFDDEGQDGAAEDICNPISPAISGNVTPADALGAFDGAPIDGQWQISVSDEATGDAGLLFQWCIDATVIEVADEDFDGDGVFDSIDNCTNVVNAGQTDTDGDGIGNRCDADYDNNCVVNFADISQFVPGFNTAFGDPAYDENLDADSSGTIGFIDFITLTSSFLMAPGPSANECVVVPD